MSNETLTNEPLARELVRLFISQKEVYTKQLLTKELGYQTINEPITLDLIQQHLEGTITIGTYSLDSDNNTNCITFDVDNHRNIDDEIKLYEKKGITPYTKKVEHQHKNEITCERIQKHFIDKYKYETILERSGSPHSYHVHLPVEKISGKKARIFGNKILKELDRKYHDEDYVYQKMEIFPKQDELAPGKIGNQIKLPCGRHKIAHAWSEIIIPNNIEDKNLLHYLQSHEPIKLSPKLTKEPITDYIIVDESPKLSSDGITHGKTPYDITPSNDDDETDEDEKIKHLLKKLVRAKACYQIIYKKGIQLDESERLARLYIMNDLCLKNYNLDDIHTFFKSQKDYSSSIVDEKFDEVKAKHESIRKEKKEKKRKEEILKEIEAESKGKKYVKIKKEDKNWRPFIPHRKVKKVMENIKGLESTCEACELAYIAKKRANSGDKLDLEKDWFLPFFVDRWKAIQKHGIRSKLRGGGKGQHILISRKDLMKYTNISETEYSGYIIMLIQANFIKTNQNNEYHRINYYPDGTTQVLKFNIKEIKEKMKGIKKIKR